MVKFVSEPRYYLKTLVDTRYWKKCIIITIPATVAEPTYRNKLDLWINVTLGIDSKRGTYGKKGLTLQFYYAVLIGNNFVFLLSMQYLNFSHIWWNY